MFIERPRANGAHIRIQTWSSLLGRSVSIMEKIERNVLLASYTTFKIGGPAKYFAEARSINEVQEFCHWARQEARQAKEKIPVFILGGGSNVLISDKGFEGLVIKFQVSSFKFQDNKVFASAGTPLAKLVSETASAGLTGLEWAIGIPGTMGGAICGNTGAFAKQISNAVESVKVLDINNLKIEQFNNSNCDFHYRDSIFKRNHHLIILEVILSLKQELEKKIRGRIKDYNSQRIESLGAGQSANWRSSGCFFKNIEWKRKDINKKELLKNFPELKQFVDKPKISAGFLIEFAGLKGKRIDDAMVSNQHADFILNLGNSTAEHVIMLAGLIKERIHSRYGFNLENEVQLIGF